MRMTANGMLRRTSSKVAFTPTLVDPEARHARVHDGSAKTNGGKSSGKRNSLALEIAFALVCGQWAIRTDPVVAHPADREAIHLRRVLPCQQLMY